MAFTPGRGVRPNIATPSTGFSTGSPIDGSFALVLPKTQFVSVLEKSSGVMAGTLPASTAVFEAIDNITLVSPKTYAFFQDPDAIAFGDLSVVAPAIVAEFIPARLITLDVVAPSASVEFFAGTRNTFSCVSSAMVGVFKGGVNELCANLPTLTSSFAGVVGGICELQLTAPTPTAQWVGYTGALARLTAVAPAALGGYVGAVGSIGTLPLTAPRFNFALNGKFGGAGVLDLYAPLVSANFRAYTQTQAAVQMRAPKARVACHTY